MWDFYDPEQPSGGPPRPELDGCARVFLAALIGGFAIILTILLLWPWGHV
jgi:hypothetical protein